MRQEQLRRLEGWEGGQPRGEESLGKKNSVREAATIKKRW